MATTVHQLRSAQNSKSGPPRNVAVFIDGTWNRAGTRNPTNVLKLYAATPKGIFGGREQRTRYFSGVGTKPKFDVNALDDADYNVELSRYFRVESSPFISEEDQALIGGATGMGTAARIRAAYHYVCKHFRPRSSDQVFLFGFSRGAFAARSLAGFMGRVGLLLANKLEHVERAYAIYERGEDAAQTELGDFLYELTGRRFVTPDDDFYVPMHFLGVWDTVASLGLPSRMQWFTAPFTEYHQVECPPSVMTARHALALHELRGAFEPLLWEPGTHSDLQQQWFAGAHADVGGGYKAGEDGLSDTALRWMATEAEKAGLVVDKAATWWTKGSGRLEVHHEIRNLFLATWPTPRSWLFDSEIQKSRSHLIHESAWDYLKAVGRDYEFKLPHVNAALRRVDAEAFRKAIYLLLRG